MQETIDAVVRTVVSDYAHFDNMEGWLIPDEPSGPQFHLLGCIVLAFQRSHRRM